MSDIFNRIVRVLNEVRLERETAEAYREFYARKRPISDDESFNRPGRTVPCAAGRVHKHSKKSVRPSLDEQLQFVNCKHCGICGVLYKDGRVRWTQPMSDSPGC